jgi:hypothetical protein
VEEQIQFGGEWEYYVDTNVYQATVATSEAPKTNNVAKRRDERCGRQTIMVVVVVLLGLVI